MNRRNKTYEAPDMADMIRRVARGLVRRAAEGDLEALSALAESEQVMREALTAAIREAHDTADYSWGQIGSELHMSRQAAQQRSTQPTNITPTARRSA